MLCRLLGLFRSSTGHLAQVPICRSADAGPQMRFATPADLLVGNAGKSKLLVAMLHLMVHYMRSKSPESGQPKRVLLAAHTNIAVDRILLGLLDSGCTGAHAHLPHLAIASQEADLPAWVLLMAAA